MPVSRKRLLDFMTSEWAQSIGYCSGDTAAACRVVNRSQERLLTCREAGDTGWFGCYAEMAFDVAAATPYLTLPRGVARIIRLDMANQWTPVRNQWYEYLEFGSGRWPKLTQATPATFCDSGAVQALRRNTVATKSPLTTPGYTLRFMSDSADDGKKVMVSGKDASGQPIRSLNNGVSVNGIFVTLASPFVDLIYPSTTAQYEVSEITGLQKEVTQYAVSVYEVNIATSATNLLVQMEGGETVAAYTRYYLDTLPTLPTGQVNAMVKLDLIPVRVPTDYLLIQSIEALICEAQSARLGDTDEPVNKSQAKERHKEAIGYLNGLSVHYEGKESAAVIFKPFGSASLRKYGIGTLR